MKRINKEQVVAVCVLATIILLFGSFLLESITLIAILVALAGMGATIFICEQKSCPLTFRNITSLFLCIILLGNLVTPAFATSEEATASIRYGYAENGNGRDLPIFLRDEINICVETYHLSPEMSDEDLANVYFMLDSQEAKDLWLKANIHLADAQNLSQEDANILASEENTQLCLRFYGVVKQIVETVPMVASTSGSLNGFNVTGGTTHDWVLSTGKIDITVKPRSEQQSDCSYKYYAQEDTLTLSATQSGTFMMQLDTKSSSTDTVKINGTTIPNGGNSGVLELETGDTVTISIKGTDNVSSNTTVSLSYSFTQQNSELSIIFKPASTPYTVNNTVIGSEEQEVKGTSFKVTVNSNNYVLTGATFVDNDQNSTFITAVGGILTPGTNGSITPIFGYDSDADNVSPFLVDKTTYWFWDDAVAAAQSSTKVVILNDDHTLKSGDYIVPSGITFLVPFDSANTLCTTSPATSEAEKLTNPSAYRTLTMESGANISVNGAISISGTQHTAMAAGTPFGPVGFIKMASGSTITINSGANLYAWGYITGSGSVTVKSGGSVYECFQISDWRGGSSTSKMVDNDERIFPLTQYHVQNVEVPMTLEAGATEYGHMAVDVTLAGVQKAPVPFIADSGAMFKISSGSLTKRYDGTTDRMIFDISNANVSLSSYSISIKVSLIGTIKLDTAKYVLPIASNMTLNINSGSDVSIDQDIAFLPGTEVNIEEGANCQVIGDSKLYVYDLDNWGKYCGAGNAKLTTIAYAPGKTYTRTEADLKDATIKVNGTVDASAGYIYTTDGGANIYSEGKGKIIQRAGSETVTYQATYVKDGYTPNSINITPAKLKNADGSYIETSKSKTNPNTYTYSDGYWRCKDHTYGDAIETKAPTCTEAGAKASTCSVCGYINSEEVPALGHTSTSMLPVLPTFDKAGTTGGAYCSVCNTVITAPTTIPAAQVGNITYQILKEAIAAADRHKNVVLLSNINGDVPVGKHVTIEKGSYTANIVADTGFTLAENGTATTVLIKIIATNMKASDGLDLFFYVNSATLTDPDGYVARVTRTYADGTSKTLDVALESYNATLTRFCYEAIAAKEMTDTVTGTLCYKDGTPASNSYTESVKNYAMRTMKDEKSTQTLITALVDMLNYGAGAQTYFKYAEANLANADPELSKYTGTSGNVELKETFVKGDNIVGTSVSAKNKLMMTFYFQNITQQMSAKISYTDRSGNNISYTIPGEKFYPYNSWYGVDVTGVPVANGRALITCEVYDGETLIGSAADSVEGYAARTAQQGYSVAVVMQQLMWFVDSAAAYFDSIK